MEEVIVRVLVPVDVEVDSLRSYTDCILYASIRCMMRWESEVWQVGRVDA